MSDYNQCEYNFLNQIWDDKKFRNIQLLQTLSSTVAGFAYKLQNSETLQRQATIHRMTAEKLDC